MLMQVMQMDPRFTDVFGALTGINMDDMAENRAKYEANQEELSKKAEAEAEAKRKAEDEAALPSEAKMQMQRAKDAEAKKAQGTEFYKKRDFAKALELYREAMNMNPDELLYYSNVAAVQIESKNFEDAIKTCDMGIEKSRGGPYDYVKLAKVIARKASALEKSGRLDEAMKCYQAALLENND